MAMFFSIWALFFHPLYVYDERRYRAKNRTFSKNLSSDKCMRKAILYDEVKKKKKKYGLSASDSESDIIDFEFDTYSTSSFNSE